MNPRSHQLVKAFSLACSPFLFQASASAAFVLVDNFESRALAPIGGQGGWTSGSSNFVVAAEPANPSNQVLNMPLPGAGLTRSVAHPVTLADNTTGTLFFRLQRTDVWNFSIGMTDLASPTGITNNTTFNDYETQLNFNRNEGGGTATYSRFNDASNSGGGFRNIDSITGNASQDFDVAPNTWYQFWIVTNSTTNTSNVWVSPDGASSPMFQLLNETDGSGDFRFRNGTTNTNDLVNLFLTASSGTSGDTFIDDIHFDAAGQNLINPIPEPAVSGLLGIGGLALLRRRRR